jgi:hypothetical protein
MLVAGYVYVLRQDRNASFMTISGQNVQTKLELRNGTSFLAEILNVAA